MNFSLELNSARAAFSRRRLRAFTLLELLIAVSIFAVVLGSINAVFFAALRLRNRSAAAFDKAVPLEQALAIIRRDLANIVPPGTGVFSGPLQSSPTTNAIGNLSGPVFFTTTGRLDDLTPFGDVQKVSYSLVESTNRMEGRDLVRLASRNLLSPVQDVPGPEWLLSGVTDIHFLFYDGSQWREYWDSAAELTRLPRAIKMQIQRAPDSGERPGARLAALPPLIELVVPMASDGGTNETTSIAPQS